MVGSYRQGRPLNTASQSPIMSSVLQLSSGQSFTHYNLCCHYYCSLPRCRGQSAALLSTIVCQHGAGSAGSWRFRSSQQRRRRQCPAGEPRKLGKSVIREAVDHDRVQLSTAEEGARDPSTDEGMLATEGPVRDAAIWALSTSIYLTSDLFIDERVFPTLGENSDWVAYFVNIQLIYGLHRRLPERV